MNNNRDDNQLNKSVSVAPGPLFVLFLCALAAFSFFLTPIPLDNINSRLDLVTAIVRDHSVSIDKYHSNTIDKAYLDGHFYSDKAPGASFSVVPIAFGYNIFRSADPGDLLFRLLCTIFAVSLPAAFMVYLFLPVSAQAAESEGMGFACTAALFFSSIYFVYATLFYGHVPGAVLSFWLFNLMLWRPKIGFFRLVFAGLISAWMVITEYTLALHVIVILFFYVKRNRELKWIPPFLAGAAGVVILFMFYNAAAFGKWYSIGYFHESWKPFAAGMGTGLAGITFPKLSHLYQILLSPGRGLLFLSPFLLIAMPGFFSGLKEEKWRPLAMAAGIMVLSGILLNASYYMPGGGMAAGPRHLVPIIPYMVFLCAFSLRTGNDMMRGVFIGLTISSAALHLLINFTDPHTPVVFDFPAMEYSLTMFIEGVTRPSWISWIVPMSGTVLLPLYVILVLLLIFPYLRKISSRRSNIPRSAAALLFSIIIAAGTYAAAFYAHSGNERSDKRYYLARTFRMMERPIVASYWYKKALDENPDNANAHFGLAQLSVTSGNMETAIKHFSMAAELDPSFAEAHYNLANLLHRSGRTDRAYTHYEAYINAESLGNNVKRARAFAAMSVITLERGDRDAALNLFYNAEKLSPSDPSVIFARKRLFPGRTSR